MLIPTIGYNWQPFFIAKDKILGMQEIFPEVHADGPLTEVIVLTGNGSEEWKIRESVQSLRVKYDNA